MGSLPPGKSPLDPPFYPYLSLLYSGVARLERARVQGFQKDLLVFPHRVRLCSTAMGPRARHALHALLLRHCFCILYNDQSVGPPARQTLWPATPSPTVSPTLLCRRGAFRRAGGWPCSVPSRSRYTSLPAGTAKRIIREGIGDRPSVRPFERPMPSRIPASRDNQSTQLDQFGYGERCQRLLDRRFVDPPVSGLAFCTRPCWIWRLY